MPLIYSRQFSKYTQTETCYKSTQQANPSEKRASEASEKKLFKGLLESLTQTSPKCFSGTVANLMRKRNTKFSDPYTRGHLFYIQLKEGIKLGWKKNCYYEYLHGQVGCRIRCQDTFHMLPTKPSSQKGNDESAGLLSHNNFLMSFLISP